MEVIRSIPSRMNPRFPGSVRINRVPQCLARRIDGHSACDVGPGAMPGIRLTAAACYVAAMSKTPDRMIAGFTTGERDYIRRELDVVFSTLPSVAEGFQLKTWRGGPDAGKPKLSPIAKGLIARGLMRLDASSHFPRLFFTEEGLTALRAMMTDRRLADPKKFAHVQPTATSKTIVHFVATLKSSPPIL